MGSQNNLTHAPQNAVLLRSRQIKVFDAREKTERMDPMYVQQMLGNPYGGDFGFTKKISRAAKRTTRAAAKSKVVRTAAKVAHAPTYISAKIGQEAFEIATKPLKTRVRRMRDGRARKLAIDRRGPNAQPTPQESREATNWTKDRLKKSGPQGYLLALFAGAPTSGYLGMSVNLGVEPATMTLIMGSIPVLMKLLDGSFTQAVKSGDIVSVLQTGVQAQAAYEGQPIPQFAPRPQAAQPPRPAPIQEKFVAEEFVPEPEQAMQPESDEAASAQCCPCPSDVAGFGSFGTLTRGQKIATGLLIAASVGLAGTALVSAATSGKKRRRS
jgi:hypothetical protein